MNYEPIVEAWINGNRLDAVRMLTADDPNPFAFASICMDMKDALAMYNPDDSYIFHRFISTLGVRDE